MDIPGEVVVCGDLGSRDVYFQNRLYRVPKNSGFVSGYRFWPLKTHRLLGKYSLRLIFQGNYVGSGGQSRGNVSRGASGHDQVVIFAGPKTTEDGRRFLRF